MRAWRYVVFRLTSTQTFLTVLTPTVENCVEDTLPLQWRNQVWQCLEEGAEKRHLERVYAIDLMLTHSLPQPIQFAD